MKKAASFMDYSVSLSFAHVWGGALAVPLFFATCGLHLFIWGLPFVSGVAALIGVLIAVIPGIVAHELLHAVGFVYAGGASRRDIRFGVMWKVLAPSTHCKAIVSASAYRFAVVLPALLLGVAPTLIGLVTGVGALTFFGYIMLLAACGDFALLWATRSVPAAALVKDHSSSIGCSVAEDRVVLTSAEPFEAKEENTFAIHLTSFVLFVLGFVIGFFIIHPSLH